MRAIAAGFYTLWNRYLYWIDIPELHVGDVVEIVIIAFVLYHFLVWIKSTRAWVLFKGLLVVLVLVMSLPFIFTK